jgi:alpha-beta hydrolase superfamily lysophospholipase
MPGEADSKYALWKAALKKEFARLADGAILLGHSIGATILINVLTQVPFETALRGIFLISVPLWVGAAGLAMILSRCRILVRHWRNNGGSIFTTAARTIQCRPGHVDLYEKAIPQALFRRLAGRDHQLNEDLSEVAADIRKL